MSWDLGHWLTALRTIGGEVLSDHAAMTTAGLAFYSLLGIVAVTALYGLIADPAVVQNLIEGLRGFLPGQHADFLSGSLKNGRSGFGLGFGFASAWGSRCGRRNGRPRVSLPRSISPSTLVNGATSCGVS